MPFLLLFGILYTDSTGLWAGSSATSIFAVLVSVWKSGASADTSHWYFPEMIRGTERNVTVCSFDFDSCVCVCEREIERHRENEHQYVIVYIWFSTRQSLVWQYFALFFTSILYSAWVGREIKTKHGFIYRVWNKDRFLLKMLCKCVFKIRLLNLHKLIFTSPDKELTKRENWNFLPRWIKHLFCSTIEYR